MSTDNLKTLRRSLSDLLAKEEPDFDQILHLANAIGRADPNFVRFSTDAAIISRLGRELVSKQETALAELVKNAYDADATKLTLTFRNTSDEGGVLEIADNGHGMTREEIVNGFMRLSTDEKLRHPVSPRYKRDRAGAKGIGRFAAERLGHRLILTTNTKRANKALRVNFDWDAFEAGRDIGSIGNEISEVDVPQKKGTVLVIENLRDRWSDAQIRQVWRYVASLQTPFPIRRVRKDKKADPGFETWFYRDDASLDEKEVIAEPKDFFKHALAEVHLRIDEKGRARWWLKSKRYGDRRSQPIGRDRDKPTPLLHAKKVALRAYYYIRSSELYPWGMFKPLNDILLREGGVRLYRNGYRVLPYGEQANDWLGLDYIYRQRSSVLSPIGNNNWFGYVTVEDQDGDIFQETSSREGLIENEAYKELVEIVSSTLLNTARHVDNARETEKAVKAAQRRRAGEQRREEVLKDKASRVKLAVDLLVARARSAGEDPKSEEAAEELRDAVYGISEGYEEKLQALADENAMLRIVASMGLTIAEFTHEYGSRAGAMKNDLDTVLASVASLDSIDSDRAIRAAAERLRSHFNDVEGFSTYFAYTVAQNQSRKTTPVELFAFAEHFVKQMRPLFGQRITTVELVEPKDPTIYTTPMHPSEWSSILMNFMTNSRKAVERRQISDGKIRIESGHLDDETVFLTFADNGDGIPEENEDRIFEPFFTTTGAPSAWAKEEEQLTGIGLGLKIVSDIAKGVRGETEVVDPPKGYVTAIRVSVPAATDEELEALYEDQVPTD